MMGFIDTMRAEGHAVESICRVLREQGCEIAARTYRSWKQLHRRLAARTVSDARVLDAVRDLAWRVDDQGRRKLTPEGLYGRRKMTALVRRRRLPDASFGAVDRAMCSLASPESDETSRFGPRSRPRTASELVTCWTATSLLRHRIWSG